MKQIWISKAGTPDVLKTQTAPDPIPHNGEIRIRVQASGVNFADIMGRMGTYPDAPSIPYVPGYEVAGVIDMVGQGVPNFKDGDNVFAATRFGGYSDVVCAPYKQAFKRLDWMPVTDAAALPVNYMTAYMMLIVMGSLKPGDKVLIHNAGGGVGLAALDICNIIGAETLGTASPEKHQFLIGRGLRHPIDYRNRDFEQVVQDITGGQGVQLILDPIGGKVWPKNYRSLSPTGRLVHFGISSTATGTKRSLLGLLRMLVWLPFYTPFKLMNDNKAIIGANLGHMWEHADMMQDWMRQIVAWYDEALFRPHIDKTFKFEDAPAAHQYIQSRKNIGKVLLIP
ncbi:MAG: zinc-binding dehydrogenase [Ardenticatenaceae bacterium]|nr:zinc-binding dehydrogenase [Ardenticatenaceae bacterium]MCB9446076.1 zinc-binding dehydrogenase [Ardenticatenaceae bacterium]